MRQNINLIVSNMGWYVFKTYFAFLLWWPFCYVGSNLLPIFSRGHYAEYITEIILSFDHWLRSLDFYFRYFIPFIVALF